MATTTLVSPVASGPSDMSAAVEVADGEAATFCLYSDDDTVANGATGQLFMLTPGEDQLISNFGKAPVTVHGPASVAARVSRVPVGAEVGIALYR